MRSSKVEHVDDERSLGNGIIVSLMAGHCWNDPKSEPQPDGVNEHVRGFDRCSTQAERDIVADAWARKREDLDARSEQRANAQAAIYHGIAQCQSAAITTASKPNS